MILNSKWSVILLSLVSLVTCKERSSRSSEKMIGGFEASKGQIAGVVHIGKTCTAAKIADRLYLTAAHCVYGGLIKGKNVSLVWGLNVESDERLDVNIVKAEVHPDYLHKWNLSLIDNIDVLQDTTHDVAILELGEETPAVQIAKVNPIKLNVNDGVILTGYGKEWDPLVGPAPATEDVKKLKYFPSKIGVVNENYVTVLRNDDEGNEGRLASGDSGGPLYLAQKNDGLWNQIVGVNSYKLPSQNIFSAVVRLDKPNVIEWINSWLAGNEGRGDFIDGMTKNDWTRLKAIDCAASSVEVNVRFNAEKQAYLLSASASGDGSAVKLIYNEKVVKLEIVDVDPPTVQFKDERGLVVFRSFDRAGTSTLHFRDGFKVKSRTFYGCAKTS